MGFHYHPGHRQSNPHGHIQRTTLCRKLIRQHFKNRVGIVFTLVLYPALNAFVLFLGGDENLSLIPGMFPCKTNQANQAAYQQTGISFDMKIGRVIYLFSG